MYSLVSSPLVQPYWPMEVNQVNIKLPTLTQVCVLIKITSADEISSGETISSLW